MTVPLTYRKSPEISINYDFIDLLTNVGYIKLYGISDEADAKYLVREPIESTDVYSRITGTTGNVESNFDFQFLLDQLIKGDLFVTITIEADGFASASATNDTTVEIFHVQGVTETSIGTQQSIAQLTNPVSTAADQSRHTLRFAVNKKFKKNDKLRVEVISTVASANANSWAAHYHDGADRDLTLTDQYGVSTHSNLIVLVPFDLGGKL